MTTSEKPRERRGVMQSLTGLSVRYVERLMPDPYLFAVILTLIVAALVAMFVQGAAPAGMLKAWYGGVWGQQNIFTRNIRNDAGEAVVELVRKPGMPGVNGSGSLVNLVFQAVGKGSTQVSLAELNVKDSKQQPVAVQPPVVTVNVE